MRAAVKNFFHSVDGVSYNNDLGDGLINAASDGKKLHLHASHECGMMYCLCEQPISVMGRLEHEQFLFSFSFIF